MKRFRVGITAANQADNLVEALWSNGIGQNVAYLIMLLQRLNCVESVCVISGAAGKGHALARAFGVPTRPLPDALSELDLVIELGARAMTPEMLETLHANGGKLVSYVAGNVMIMGFEELACGAPHGDSVFSEWFDACWVTPQHWHTCHSYLEATRSPRTREAPHIWDPHCIRAAALENGKNPYYRPPDDGKWLLGCFDPSVNVVKTFHFPVLVADQAYRRRPDLIAGMMLFSAESLKRDPHVEQFIAATDMGKKGLVSVESRHPFMSMMGKHVHAVVTHQWQNSLNYLYWDTLFLGWPLIHNSPDFQDVGYYYPEFDPKAGGEALVEGLATHDERFAADRRRVFDLLWRFSVDNPDVQRAYADLIHEVMEP